MIGGRVSELPPGDLMPTIVAINPATIDRDLTIPAGHNALSVGPIRVADGVTVTGADGSRWRVV